MFELTGSAVLMAVNLMVRSIPNVLFQPITGAIADKLSKKRVLMLCKLARSAAMLSMALLLLFDMTTVATLLAFTFLCSTIEAMRAPADASTFLIAFLMIIVMRHKETKFSGKINLKSTKQYFSEGITYIKANHIFGALLVLGMISSAMVVPFSAFSVMFITDYLLSGLGFFSAIKVTLSVAAVVGAIVTPKIKGISNKKLIIASGIVMGLCMSLLGLLPEIGPLVLRQGLRASSQ